MNKNKLTNTFQFLGLKGKFILLISLLLLLMGGLTSWMVISNTREAMETEMLEKGTAIAKNLAYNAVYGIIVEDSEVLNQFITGINDEIDIGYVIILDQSRKVLAHSDIDMTGKVLDSPVSKLAVQSDEVLIQEYTSQTGTRYYDIATPVLNKNAERGANKIGTVRIGVTKQVLDDKIAHLVTLGALISIVTLILGIFISIYFINLIIKPIEQMATVSQQIAAGNFTQEITVTTNDEVGRLGMAFSTMAKKLKEIITQIKGVSISLASVAEEILISSNKVHDGARMQAASAEQTASSVEEMNASIREITESVEVLSSASEESSSSVLEMSASISEVAGNANKLSDAVEETTSSITEISSSIKQVAENVEILAETSNETNTAVSTINKALNAVGVKAQESTMLSKKVTSDAEHYGIKSINKTIKGMENIKETIMMATEVINRLGERSKRIGKVLTVIDEVTKQTNLLALNAAILAAQAGEQGKGFAVVADEIKNLADRTDASTKEISGLISDVQNETTDAIASIKKGSISVEEGMKISLEAGDALQKIFESSKLSTAMTIAIEQSTAAQVKEIATVADSIMQVTSMAGQISKATHDQTKGAGQIMMAAEKMRDISKHVSRTTEEQAKTSRQISISVENVTSRVSQIAKSIREQKKGSEIIMKSIRNISEISQESVQLSSRMSTTVDVLSQQAEKLKAEVNQFQVE